MSDQETKEVAFGATSLPDEQRQALRKGRRLEWISLGVVACAVTIMVLVMGSSQAMKAAWYEDLLSFLPPISFLVAARVARKPPSASHPWGHHRSVGVGHLASAIALLVMGLFVTYEGVMTLVKREHPTIGTVHLLGHTFWQGWLMIAALVVTAIPVVVLGRMKLKVAQPLHDKILFADADMMRADWLTSGGAVLGITLIGFGFWWADAAVATLIGCDILKDGVTNVRNAVRGLTDATARTHDDKDVDPLVARVQEVAERAPGVHHAAVRVRDMGHLFHAEVFVVPDDELTVEQLDHLRRRLVDLDWKLEDLTVSPVRELPTWNR